MGLTLTLAAVEIFTVILQRIFCENTLVRKKEEGLQDVVAWAGFFLVFNLATYGIRMFTDVVWAGPVIFVVCFFPVLECLYADSARILAVVTAFMYLGGMCCELVVYYGKEFLPRKPGADSELLYMVSSKIIWFCVIKVGSLLVRKHRKVRLYLGDWLEVFIVPVGSIWILVAVFIMGSREMYFLAFMAVVMILVINVFTYWLYEKTRETMERRMREEALARQCDYYIRQNRESAKWWEELRAFRHDMKQHYLVEMAYLEAGDLDMLKKYCRGNLDILDWKGNISRTGNVYVDSLINYKADAAARAGVELKADIHVPEDAGLDAEDLDICLGNLLDNAIEAAEKLEKERKVELAVTADHSNLYLHIRNRYAGELKREKGQYLTSKDDDGSHGLGLSIVRQVAAKYRGIVQVTDEGGEFDVTVLLYGFLG